MKFRGYEKAWRGDRNNALVRSFLAGLRSVEPSEKLGFVLKTGTSDMNVVGPAWQCPIVAYGPGDSALDHTPNEHLSIDEYWKAVNVIEQTLRGIRTGGLACNAARRYIYNSRHMPSAVDRAVNIADLRRLAKRRLPRMAFDYIDGGAEREWTLRENIARVRGRAVPSAIGGRHAKLRSQDQRARHAARSAVHPGAGRQQPHVLSTRRGARRDAPPVKRARSTRCRRCPAAAWKT